MTHDFLDNLGNHIYQKMHQEKMNEYDKITPQTYEDMNKEFEEEGTMLRITVPTQEEIDKWKEDSKKVGWIEPPQGKDMVAEMWEEHRQEQEEKEREKQIEMNFGSDYESGIEY